MSNDINEVIDNVRQGSTWLRVLFMLGYCVALYIAGVVVLFLTAAQALFVVFSGADNRNLRELGSALSVYVSEVLNFITYNSNDKPFPFAPFPNAVETEGLFTDRESKAESKSATQSKKASAAKPAKKTSSSAAKKSTAKKKTAVKKKTTAKKKSAGSSDS